MTTPQKRRAPSPLTEFVGPLRMSARDLKALEKLAVLNERSVAAEIRMAVKAWLTDKAA